MKYLINGLRDHDLIKKKTFKGLVTIETNL